MTPVQAKEKLVRIVGEGVTVRRDGNLVVAERDGQVLFRASGWTSLVKEAWQDYVAKFKAQEAKAQEERVA